MDVKEYYNYMVVVLLVEALDSFACHRTDLSKSRLSHAASVQRLILWVCCKK